MSKIKVLSREVTILSVKEEDYICLTDIARYKNQDGTDDLIRNWLRNRNTLEFLGVWEHLNNPDFNPVEFDGIKMQSGLNSFALTPKQWIEKTGAIGITSKAGRYGGTYAHKDIAFEFVPQPDRLTRLNQIAIQQMKLLTTDSRLPRLPGPKEAADE